MVMALACLTPLDVIPFRTVLMDKTRQTVVRDETMLV